MNIGLSKYESTSATCAITNTQCCQSVIRNVVYKFVVELISLKIPLLKRYTPPALYTLQEYVPTGGAVLCSWRVINTIYTGDVNGHSPLCGYHDHNCTTCHFIEDMFTANNLIFM